MAEKSEDLYVWSHNYGSDLCDVVYQTVSDVLYAIKDEGHEPDDPDIVIYKLVPGVYVPPSTPETVRFP